MISIMITILITYFLGLTLGGEWTDALWQDYSFMVRLDIEVGSYHYICGGSIISLNEWNGKGVILTAAHCVQGANNVNVWVGCTQTSCTDYGATSYNDDHYIIHPDYRPKMKTSHINWSNNDIALIFLSEPITNVGATKIDLHGDINVLSNNDHIVVFGYYGSCGGGSNCVGGSDTDALEYADTNFMIAQECDDIWGESVTGPHDFCVKDDNRKNGLQGVCMGDSGSPLTFNGKVIGLNSWGPADCDPKLPTVATSVPYYYGWIANQCPECIATSNVVTMCCTPSIYGGGDKWISTCPQSTNQIQCEQYTDRNNMQRCLWQTCDSIIIPSNGKCIWNDGNKGSQRKCSKMKNMADCNAVNTCHWTENSINNNNNNNMLSAVFASNSNNNNNNNNNNIMYIGVAAITLFTICAIFYCCYFRKGKGANNKIIDDSSTPLITVIN